MPPRKKHPTPKPPSKGKKRQHESGSEDEESMADAAPQGEGEGADAAPGSGCHKLWGENDGNSEGIPLVDLVRADEDKQIRCAACCPFPHACDSVHVSVVAHV
jgi:hypothetical protein